MAESLTLKSNRMSTNVQNQKEKTSQKLKKNFRSFLKLFIRIDKIPFTDNGKNVEYCTMYIFGLAICSNIYPSNTENYNGSN